MITATPTQQTLTVQFLQNAIYEHGALQAIAMLRDALIQVGKHDPLSEELAEQISEVLCWHEDFSQCKDEVEIEPIQPTDDLPF